MKMFSKIKKLFSKDVLPDGVCDKVLTVCKPKGGKFVIGTKLVVPAGCQLVVVRRGKVLEQIVEGEYEISPTLMPNIAKKCKLNKVDKSGKTKESFAAEAYYVKKDCKFVCDISNFRQLKFSQGQKSYFKVKFDGKVECSIENIKTFFKSMQLSIPSIREDSAQFVVGLIVNEVLTNKLDRANFSKQQYESKEQTLLTFVEKLINSSLSNIGLKTENIEIEFQVSERLSKDDKPPKSKKTKAKKHDEKNKEATVAENVEVAEPVDTEEVAMYEDQIAQEANASKSKRKSKNKKDFVDLSLEHLYDDKVTKKCSVCGQDNSIDEKICSNCKTSLEE